MGKSVKLPVLFLIFNRYDVLAKALEPVRRYRPDRIYIAADGPRATKKGEDALCRKTRETVLSLIDWPCEVKTLFREENLGCADAVSSAIDWFFEHEEFGIILEDDIVLADDFFPFCEEIGNRYKEEDRIMMVASQYLGLKKDGIGSSYGFSPWAMIWGWATWKRAWENMDMSFSRWPEIKVRNLIARFGWFKGLMLAKYWRHDYKTISSGGNISSWATRWALNMAALNGLTVMPFANLSVNVGCSGTDGAHYSKNDKDPYSHLKLSNLDFPLHHPSEVKLTSELVKLESKDFFRIRMIGLKKILKSVLKRK